MALELFFTSAERGLALGSFGYCTVARTARMPRGVQSRLEDMSVYKPLFPPHDPRADMNPVAVSHLRISADGQSYSVLTRIASAAPDYSGRTNYLAHHVVLASSERSPGGPGWLSAQAGVLSGAWDGQVREIPSARSLPRGSAGPAVCHAWQRLTGDAGWAGVLAEHLMTKSTQAFYLVSEPGQDLLPLVAEALALLPPQRRWDITFSTYFSGSQKGVACTIRGVIKGTEEAVQARSAAHLDLSALANRAPPENAWVVAARTGEVAGPTPIAPASPMAPIPVGPAATGDVFPRSRESAPMGFGHGRRAFGRSDADMPELPPSSGNRWIWILTGMAAALLILGGVVILVLNSDRLTAGPQVAQGTGRDGGRGGRDEPNQPGNRDKPPPAAGKKEGGAEPVDLKNPPQPPKGPDEKPGGPPTGAGKTLPKPEDVEKGLVGKEPPQPADPRLAEMEKKLAEMKAQLDKANEAKTQAEAAADKAAKDAQQAKDDLAAVRKKYESPSRALIEGRKGDSVKVSLTDEEPRSAPFPELLKPSDMMLVPKPGVVPEEKVAGKYYVTWNWGPSGADIQFDVNAHLKKGQGETELYVRILLETVASPEKKNVTGIKTKVARLGKAEADDQKALVDYLKQHQLLIVELQRYSIGQRRFEYAPRLTVVEFEEHK